MNVNLQPSDLVYVDAVFIFFVVPEDEVGQEPLQAALPDFELFGPLFAVTDELDRKNNGNLSVLAEAVVVQYKAFFLELCIHVVFRNGIEFYNGIKSFFCIVDFQLTPLPVLLEDIYVLLR